MEEILEQRLCDIDTQLDFLREEKLKTKQALDIFKGTEVVKTSSVQTFAGEPIFKEKVKVALKDKYIDGATANEILAYVNAHWKRQIERSSLSPQLSRLKKEGFITLKNNIWKLTEKNSAPEGADNGATTPFDPSWSHKPHVRER